LGLALGDEEAGAGPGREVSLGHQSLVSLHSGNPGDAVVGRQHSRGRHPRSRLQTPFQDRGTEIVDELILQGACGAPVESQAVPERRYRARCHLSLRGLDLSEIQDRSYRPIQLAAIVPGELWERPMAK